jgi:hypothetical protein
LKSLARISTEKRGWVQERAIAEEKKELEDQRRLKLNSNWSPNSTRVFKV